jgi:hypothetical protein
METKYIRSSKLSNVFLQAAANLAGGPTGAGPAQPGFTLSGAGGCRDGDPPVRKRRGARNTLYRAPRRLWKLPDNQITMRPAASRQHPFEHICLQNR